MISEEHKARLMRRASTFSVSVAFLLVSLKMGTYFYTHSLAILSSALDSGMDLLASIVNMIIVKLSLEPADKNHRFGHGKAEPLGALMLAAFVAGSALILALESVNRFFTPVPVSSLTVGFWVMGVSLVMTIILILYQRHVIKATGSVAIHADHAHYSGDVMMNLAVIFALAGSHYFGLDYIDSVCGLGISLYLLYTAYTIVRHATDQLMDKELPPDTRAKITQIIISHPKVFNMHDLKTRASGLQSFIQFHIELDPALTLKEAHDITDQIEESLMKEIPNSEVLIHQDPVGLFEHHHKPLSYEKGE